MPPERIAVRAPDVGGGFGVKNFLYPEWVLVLWAARRLGRPVRWVAERGEDFLSSAQGRDNHTRARLALDRDGRFLALDVDTVANLGAYLSTNGPGSSTNSPASAMGGVYDIPAVFMSGARRLYQHRADRRLSRRRQARGQLPDRAPRRSRRAAPRDRPDRIAPAQRDPPLPVSQRPRHRRSIAAASRPISTTSPAHEAVRGFAERRQQAAARGRLRGLGIACFLETSRGTPGERAEIRFEPDGQVALVLGTQSNGQGHETSYPQIAADLLGLPIDAFRFVQADTREVKSGNGHGGARSMHMGGAALHQAAQMVIAKGRALAAHLLQADLKAVIFADGRFTVGHGSATRSRHRSARSRRGRARPGQPAGRHDARSRRRRL